ncbi:hypothetical protein [Actinomadura sp. 3N508]|uniref:hypothetical protein n=1 Tax=Actinomadura sp. 3N508 TaxID=3375153 RepID=UPI003799B389
MALLKDSRAWELPSGMEVTDAGLVTRDARVRLVAAWPPGAAWRRYAGGALPAAAIWRAARAYTVLAATAAVVGVGGGLIAAGINSLVALGIVADDHDSAVTVMLQVTLGAVPVAAVLGWVAAWLLRLARRVDASTPQALPASAYAPAQMTADLGQAGVRFPFALPTSFALVSVGVFFLAFVPTNLGGDDGMAVIFGTGFLVVIPLTIGSMWLLMLPRALRGGVSAARLRVIGWVYITVGVVPPAVSAVSIVAMSGADALPSGLAPVIFGALLVARGVNLAKIARDLADAGAAPLPGHT